MSFEQPELPLEWSPVDHYEVEVRSGPQYAEKLVRGFQASDLNAALDLVDAQRDYHAKRDDVEWDGEELSAGKLYGLGPSKAGGRDTWLIVVIPAPK